MAALEPDETTHQANTERLLKHLKENSLASRLVHAQRAPKPAESMMAVLRERLEQVRENLDRTEA